MDRTFGYLNLNIQNQLQYVTSMSDFITRVQLLPRESDEKSLP